jgi:hypothetical protein
MWMFLIQQFVTGLERIILLLKTRSVSIDLKVVAIEKSGAQVRRMIHYPLKSRNQDWAR